MFFWRPPVCQNYTSESGCQFGDKCLVRHTEAEGQPSKMSNNSGGLDQLLQWSLCSWVVCPKITLRESLFYVHVAPHCISGTKGSGPSRGVVRKCVSHERNPCAPKNFEDRTLQETLQQERCARRESWDLSKKMSRSSRQGTATFFSLAEAWTMFAPSWIKRSETSW